MNIPSTARVTHIYRLVLPLEDTPSMPSAGFEPTIRSSNVHMRIVTIDGITRNKSCQIALTRTQWPTIDCDVARGRTVESRADIG